MSGVTFTKDAARRIAKVVRAYEADPTVTSRPPRGRQLVPHSLDRAMMCKAQVAMVADDTEYAVKYLEADGTEGTQINVRRTNGMAVANGEVGFIGRDSSGQHVFTSHDRRDLMIIAKANMAADDTAYACKHLEADGTESTEITARRPNGVYVTSGDVGFLGQDSSGQNVFEPGAMLPPVKNSIEVDSNALQFVNDVLAPGNLYYYGTNAAGVKGWYVLGTGFTVVTVVTAVQYDTATGKFQKKTRNVTVFNPTAESDWTDVFTAVECPT